MINILILLFLLCVGVFLTAVFRKNKVVSSYSLFDLTETNMFKGMAILLVILQHLGANEHTRLLTPLGGIGVAIFFMLSDCGINETFKVSGLRWLWHKRII